MKNPTSTRKKRLTVLKAAIWGAVIPIAAMLMIDLGVAICGHGTGESGSGFWVTMEFLTGIPQLIAANVTRLLINAYCLNSLTGAFVFTLFAIIWQFLLKTDSEKPESKLPGNEMERHR